MNNCGGVVAGWGDALRASLCRPGGRRSVGETLCEHPCDGWKSSAFTKATNELTMHDQGQATIDAYLQLKQTRSFMVKDQGYLVASKSVLNRIIGDSKFE